MIKIIYDTLIYTKFFLSAFILFLPLPLSAEKIIVHSQHATTNISQDNLRAIYSMRMRVWPDGTPITVFILNPDSLLHREFCLKFLEVFPYQLQRVWDVMVYSGTGQSPINLKSESEVLRKISQTPGSIGYVSDTEVIDNVKIINIQK